MSGSPSSEDLGRLHAIFDLGAVALPRPSGIGGRIGAMLRGLLLRLLAHHLGRQSAYSAANARLHSRLWETCRAASERTAVLDAPVSEQERGLQVTRAEHAVQLEELHRQHAALRREVADRRREYADAMEALRDVVTNSLRAIGDPEP